MLNILKVQNFGNFEFSKAKKQEGGGRRKGIEQNMVQRFPRKIIFSWAPESM